MSYSECCKELVPVLQEEIKSATTLLDLLRKERDLLVISSTPPEELELLADQKDSLVQMLEVHSSRHTEILQKYQITPSKEAIDELFADVQCPVAAELWQRMLDVVKTCHEENQANGMLTGAMQRHVNEALNILRGKQPGKGATYNQYGQSGQAHTVSRPLASA